VRPTNRSTVGKEGARTGRDFITALVVGFEEAVDVIKGEDSLEEAVEDVRERLEELEDD